MTESEALEAFAAISQETRLRIVRMLVVAGADGMAAGAITEALGEATASRISFHLSHLENAGLIDSRREGRSIIYSAIFPALSDLVAFLMRDCCKGHEPVAKAITQASSVQRYLCVVSGDRPRGDDQPYRITDAITTCTACPKIRSY